MERRRIIAEKLLGLKEGIDFGRRDSHDWHLEKSGEIDEWLMDYDYHNGPLCKFCGYSYCVHCQQPDELCEKEVYYSYMDLIEAANKFFSSAIIYFRDNESSKIITILNGYCRGEGDSYLESLENAVLAFLEE